MIDRFLERAKNRDPILEQNLYDLFQTDQRDNSLAQLANDPSRMREVAKEETRPFREYMVNESVQQYRDYYESDSEEQPFFEYLDNISNRDQIRFMEIFEDHTVDKQDLKDFVMIEKREYNPTLSVFSNMALDLVDFKDRVRPLSRDIAMIEKTMKYQKQNTEKMLNERDQFKKIIAQISSGQMDSASQIKEQGYSSAEIEEPKADKIEETAAEQDFEAEIPPTTDDEGKK